MYGKLNEQNLKKYALLRWLTKLILSMITIDAAYIYWTVEKMTENITYAVERYHSIPLMSEHVLAAVVIYLVCMVLIDKGSKS